MIVLATLLYSIIQAATEFLPISSSGHLLILHELAPLPATIDALHFDVALHWGTLLSLLVFFGRDLWRLLRAWVISFRKRDYRANRDARLAWLLLLGTVPPALLGYLIEQTVGETAVRRLDIVAIALVAGGILLFAADRWGGKDRTLDRISAWDALLIGTSQALAFLPGVSRSGITITAARSRHLKREDAVRLAFYFAVPITAAAGIQEGGKFLQSSPNASTLLAVLIGIAATAIAGMFVIRFLLRYVSGHSFGVFVVYRFALALVPVILLLAR